jgi:hypothetical protein
MNAEFNLLLKGSDTITRGSCKSVMKKDTYSDCHPYPCFQYESCTTDEVTRHACTDLTNAMRTPRHRHQYQLACLQLLCNLPWVSPTWGPQVSGCPSLEPIELAGAQGQPLNSGLGDDANCTVLSTVHAPMWWIATEFGSGPTTTEI